jgi:hypothetical protein
MDYPEIPLNPNRGMLCNKSTRDSIRIRLSSTALEDGPSSFAPVFSGARQGFSQLLGEGQPVLDTSHWDKHQDNRNARHVLFSMVKMQLIERQQSPALCQAHHFFPG